jgi:oligogalacturonide lyase
MNRIRLPIHLRQSQRDEAYSWRGNALVALDMNTLEERALYEVPRGWSTNMLNCSADGKYVCTGINTDLRHRFDVDLLHGYIGFCECLEAHSLSRVLRIATDGNGADVVFEEN